MTITKERIEALAKYMGENVERAEMLMDLSAEEACAKINADGYDFTAEELADFAHILAAEAKEGELSEEDLFDVAGGSISAFWAGVAWDIIKDQAPHAWNKGKEWGRKIVRWWRNR